MSEDPLPAALQEFLAKDIDSIAQLEALLLLRGTPAATWDAQDTAKRLYVSEQEAAETLGHLAAQGLLAREGAGHYRFSPASDDLSRIVELLAEYYKRHLIPITNLIHSKPRRIRQFADAFKLKRE
jgi:hypothetical protein